MNWDKIKGAHDDITVRVRVTTKPSSYSFQQNSSGLSGITYAGAASLRIIEIPN